MTDLSFYTLQDALAELAADLSVPGPIERILVAGYEQLSDPSGLYWSFRVELDEELVLTAPGLDGFGLVLRELGRVELAVGPTTWIALHTGRLAVRLPNSLFVPAARDDGGRWQAQVADDGLIGFRDIQIDLATSIRIDLAGNLNLNCNYSPVSA